MNNTSRNWWITSLWIAIFIHFILSLSISLSYHWGYISSIIDLGTFDQAVWGTLHGDFFLNTHIFNVLINYLGFHFRPILLIFLPFYAILPKAEWMILSQSLALSLTAWPIFLLAKHVSKSETVAFCWALVYMVNPFVISTPPWVFRPESLAVPFIAISLLSIEKSNFRLLLLSCFVIVLCKEHFGIMIIGFGFLWGLRNRRWKQAILIVSFGAIYSILVLGIIMPALSPTGEHVMLSQGLGQVSRYSWLGGSMKEVFQALLFHPITVAKVVLLEFGGAKYLLVLMIFFLGFPLAAPEFLLPGLADLMANILSANPMPRSPFAYHSVTLIPILTTAAIYGVKRLSAHQTRYTLIQLTGLAAIVSFSFVGGYVFAPLPLPKACNFWAPANFLSRPDPRIQTIRSLVGDNASVSAQANVGSHFSQRHEIYRYPNMVSQVDAIILRLESPTTNINNLPDQIKNNRKYLTGSLDSHLQMDRTEYITSIKALLFNNKYGVLLWDDPWLVLAQGASSHGLKQKIEQKLNRLEEEWKIDSKALVDAENAVLGQKMPFLNVR
ncbi:MAG: DUF2079 domain-containing protein [Deltaproteobacteria bacterium]|nr:DUF2079 domain-containing protein [Deltaproteobacteria bacterium]